MRKAVAINGSPRMAEGNTSTILLPFVEGMKEAGCEVETFYASRLKVKPCTCGTMYCWFKQPGECCIRDGMDAIYPVLAEAEILILASPVYIPFPGDMQNIVNRLCPLITPLLESREGRTRARFRSDVEIQRMALVATGGWWEQGNFEVLTHIVEELAANASVEFSGAVVRPHAHVMNPDGKLSKDGKAVVAAARQAGYELVSQGVMDPATLDAISRPLIAENQLRSIFNTEIEQQG